MSDLISKLEELDRSMSAAPWNENAMYEAIRHVQRNTEVMEYALDSAEEGDPKGTPDRYDGTALAQLRNLLPEIINALVVERKAATISGISKGIMLCADYCRMIGETGIEHDLRIGITERLLADNGAKP